MNANETNLIDFIAKFKKEGYTDDYTFDGGQLKSLRTGEKYALEDFTIEGACKFDITENATDQQFLYGIKTPDGKGTLVDLLANYYYDYEDLLADKFKNVEIESHLVEEAKDLKYGLPKIYKADFEKDPARYSLRIGYPDFPRCPLDSSFSMLGFDNKNDEYVWLVTSIIKDDRLKREEYKEN